MQIISGSSKRFKELLQKGVQKEKVFLYVNLMRVSTCIVFLLYFLTRFF